MRDALLGATRDDGAEIDFTTDATPDEIAGLMAPLCSALWEQGRAFGTIGGSLRPTAWRSRSRPSGPRPTWTTRASRACSGATRSRSTSVGATSRSTPWRWTWSPWPKAATTSRRSLTTSTGSRDLHEGVLRTPTDAEAPLHRRPIAHAARGALRGALLPVDRPSDRGGDDRVREPAHQGVARAHARRARPADGDRAAERRAGLHRAHGTGRALLPRAAAAPARTGPDSPTQGRPQAHLGRRRQGVAAPASAPGGLFHDVGKPATRNITPKRASPSASTRSSAPR